MRPATHKHWRSLYLCAWIVFLLDSVTKVWAVSYLSNRDSIRILGSFLKLTFVRNSGAAFSFATGATLVFSFFAIGVIAIIAYFAPRIAHRGWALLLGLLLGGILGNLSDRIFRSPGLLRGHVIDWIELAHWPIFNLADSAIVVAAGIAIVLSARNIAPITQGDNRPDQPGV